MDLEKAIRELLVERDRISGIIAQLEQMQKHRGPSSPKPRGRKQMSDEERAVVSNRMRQYWESRRQAKQASA